MAHILAGIHTPDQHLRTWLNEIDAYRPAQCPYCDRSGLWSHGVYYRQARCERGNPVPIPRFRCQHCQRTCSTLPEYMSAKRWYHWLVQQLALQLSVMGHSLMQTWRALCDAALADDAVPSIGTLQRWLRRYREYFSLHRFHLLNAIPSLGYAPGFDGFWRACLNAQPLSAVMIILNRNLVDIP